MEQSVESNFFKEFKAIASLPILRSYFRFFFFFVKRFLRKSSKPGHGNVVLITSTVQVEILNLNFNFDDIRTYFLQVLKDCRQITFIMLNGFCSVSKKIHPSVPNRQYQDGYNTNQNLLIMFWRYVLLTFISCFNLLLHQQISFLTSF